MKSLAFLALVALALATGCSSLTKPQDITISAEPIAAAPEPVPEPAPAAVPQGGAAAAPAQGG